MQKLLKILTVIATCKFPFIGTSSYFKSTTLDVSVLARSPSIQGMPLDASLWGRVTTTMSTTTMSTPQNDGVNKSALVCLDDYEIAASRILDANAWGYYSSAADEEITLRDNKLGYKRITILPRMLVDVSQRDLSTTILGKPVQFPIGVSPTAFQKLATPQGEMANARAAAAAGTIFILSTLSTSTIEDVAKYAPGGRKWFQLYIFKNRTLTQHLVQRAESSGFEALAVTVDTPLFGKRRADRRNKFRLPPNLSSTANDRDNGIALIKICGDSLANFEGNTVQPVSGDPGDTTGLEQLNYYLDASLTWKDITWLRSITRLPIYLKGILTPEDAEMAVQYGVQGVYVSNHGARNLDTAPATIDALPKIVKVVAGRCDVVVDGGIRVGTDVFKALAYGAKMVFIGRPLLWGLTVNGEEGAKDVLKIIKEEFNITLALAGVQRVNQISLKYVERRTTAPPYPNVTSFM